MGAGSTENSVNGEDRKYKRDAVNVANRQYGRGAVEW